MTGNQKPEKDAPLNRVLREWTVETPLPPRFQEQVWQRIAHAEVEPIPSIWGVLWRLIQTSLPRPQVAFAYLTVLLVLGVAAGAWAAQAKNSQLDADLGLRYVQSIDPYLAGVQHP